MKADEKSVIVNIKTRRSVLMIGSTPIFRYQGTMPPTPEKREPVVFWMQ